MARNPTAYPLNEFWAFPYEFDAFQYNARRVLNRLDNKMADDTHVDDIGELRGQVRGLQSGFTDLSRELKDGLRGLTDYIRSSAEKTDERINSQVLRTDARFEQIAKSQLDQAAGRGNTTWQVIGIAVPTLIGVAGLAFTFWSLARAPYDDKFSAMAAAISAESNNLKEYMKEQREASKNFVPAAQIKIMQDAQDKLADRQITIKVDQARFEERTKSNADLIAYLRADIKNAVTKEELDALRDRVNIISNRQQALYDKNYATPRQPCLESGAGCGPVALPGPAAQPSASR